MGWGRGRRRVRPGAMLVVLAIVLVTGATAPGTGTVLALRAEGMGIGYDGDVTVVAVGGRAGYHPGSSVLTELELAAPAVERLAADERNWLRSGRIPAGEFGAMAERALLDIRLLGAPDGVVLGAPTTMWRFVWPRDSGIVAAALATMGFHEDAVTVLRFLAGVAPPDGHWHARYRPDGSGPVLDGRARQMDGAGWVSWATWVAAETAPSRQSRDELIELMAPAVSASADRIAATIGPDGLPEPSSDYWEKAETETTIGIAGPALFGLRAAADLAPELGRDPALWRDAERRLAAAITREFGAHGYPRTVPDGGLDAAVSFLAPPFGPAGDDLHAAVEETERVLRVPNGGHRPGEAWTRDVNVAWTPETAMLALAFAGLGDDVAAHRLLTFLNDHRTSLGALPEKVDARGRPASVAPIGFTGALVLLTLAELDGSMPALPAASPS